ncbi:MAG: hypothetical protein ACRD5E_11050 [Nitrososphaeraceae archaeon]
MRNQLFVGEFSCQQISCIEPKNVSNKQTEQQTVITKCLRGYIDALKKSIKVVCFDPMYHIRSGSNELKQEDRKLDSENELIWSNDLNISSNLYSQKNGVNYVDESKYRMHRTEVVNADCSFDRQGSYPL